MAKKNLVVFEKNGKRINIETSKVPFLKEGFGLMFSKKEKANALLFHFKWNTNMTIFSYFVYYKFIAIWLDKKNKFVDMKVIDPFLSGIRPNKEFRKLIEIPINKKYKKVCDFLLKNQKSKLKIIIKTEF